MYRSVRSHRPLIFGCTVLFLLAVLGHVWFFRPSLHNMSWLSRADIGRERSAQRQQKFDDPSSPLFSDDDRFITYLPHSGLHNQRIALINAAVLAYALNRTLILPEMNMGRATYWRPYDELAGRLDVCTKQPRVETEQSVYCHEYRDYVPVPVDAIFDLRPMHALGIRTIQRHSMRADYFERYWDISSKQMDYYTYKIDDTVRYSYQIHDTPDDNINLWRFEKRLELQELESHSDKPFLLFGSLFGSQRLALTRQDLKDVREYLKQEMGVTHPSVHMYAASIVQQLGGENHYSSVHLRQGDGAFKKMAVQTMDRIRSKLVQTASENSTLINASIDQLEATSNTRERLRRCVASQANVVHPRLRLIYMATDAKNPREKFHDLFSEFLCLFTLNDFPDIVQFVTQASDAPHGRGSLLLPLVDAEVAARADFFVGTPRSTMSGYIQQRNKKFQASTWKFTKSSSLFPRHENSSLYLNYLFFFHFFLADNIYPIPLSPPHFSCHPARQCITK